MAGHIDHIKTNNDYTNLCWVTHKENIQLSYGGRTIKKGKDHHLYGKSVSFMTRHKQSVAKRGARHPKFRGYYKLDNQYFESYQSIADHLNTHLGTVQRMIKQKLITIVDSKE